MNSGLIKKEVVINWLRIFKSILKKWWLILLCLILGAAAGFGVGRFFMTQTYESESVYVVSYSGGSSVSSMYNEYNFVAKVLNNCITFVEQNKFFNEVAKNLNEGINNDDENYISTDEIASSVSYEKSADSGTVVKVIVKTSSIVKTKRIATAVNSLFESYILENYKLVGGDALTFNNASDYLEIYKTTRFSTSLCTILGGAAFALLELIILLLISLADSTVYEANDIKNRFNAPILGNVPKFTANSNGGYKYGNKQ